MRTSAAIMVLVGTILMGTTSFADPVYEFGPQPAWTFLTGISGGGSFSPDQNAGHIAGELSIVRLQSGFWTGLYTDVGYEFAIDSALITLGPEFGFRFFGIDGGGALRFVDGSPDFGATARLLLSFGFFAIYGRAFYFPSDKAIELFQVGALLKFPLWASR